MAWKVGLVSLGCPKNLVDSEIMLGFLKKDGFIITNREEEADVMIVNTCAFINDAKEESINTIFELARHKKDGNLKLLIAAGCLAQRYASELTKGIPEIDSLTGTGDVEDIVQVVSRAISGVRSNPGEDPGYLPVAGISRLLSTPSYSAYLKIGEGCDNRCSYCVIPAIRGPYRSRAMEDVLNEAALLAEGGVREFVLVAQDTTRYGIDIFGRPALADLLVKLARLEGVTWLRVMYAYPSLVTDRLIESIASEKKICRYLDLPIQHASDRILSKMNRRERRKDILKLVEKLRSAIPDIALRTSFIVGFPGETAEDFQELLDFMSTVRFDRVGVFAYSPEEDTPAAAMSGQVPEEVKYERRKKAMALQQGVSLQRNIEKKGREITVLVEGRTAGKGSAYYGRSEGDAPEVDGMVHIRSNKDLKPGQFVRVKITGASEYDLTGEVKN
ncbi:MAG: 30S ribosomal protein S12 methylthiotransferase RimO [Eubacteriales bacterium]